MEDKVEGTCEIKKSEHKLILEVSPRIPCENVRKTLQTKKANHVQVLDKYDVFEMYLFAMWYKSLLFPICTKHGESEDEKLEGVKLYEWKMCIYKQNSQNFVTNGKDETLRIIVIYFYCQFIYL